MFKKSIAALFVVITIASCSTKSPETTGCIDHQRPDSLLTITDFVDPFIGTGGHGHTFPGATMPFGMVQLSPDTRLDGWDGCGGYHYSDSIIFGFSHTHLSGTGCIDYGDILVMPFAGDLRNGVHQPSGEYASLFSHKTETARPGFYSVLLETDSIAAELTATLRTGWHRYTYPARKSSSLMIDLKHRDKVLASSIQIVNDYEVAGYRRSMNWAADQHVYFVARFSAPVTSSEIAKNDTVIKDITAAEGTNLRILLNFGLLNGKPLTVQVGISAVSIEGARRNLDQESNALAFDQVKHLADSVWNKELSCITVKGSSDDQKTIFYTALYHAFIAPNLYMDVDGNYRGRDLKIHKADSFNYCTVFSLWDTYRAEHPLFTLVQQKRTNDFINTFLKQYEQGGLLPVWELSANETNCMIGYHAVPVIADAFMKDITGYDTKLALKAMVKSARQDQYGLKYYRERGFIPSEDEGESVSRTLEYAYDDWCIATMAEAMNENDIYKEFTLRAQSYKNLFDPSTGFMRARNNDSWFSPFEPREVNFNYTEANAWQYSFYVPQDVDGLITLLGGDDGFTKKLDDLFTTDSQTTGREQSDITGLIGQYAHGNEPSHHMAYLYSYAGKPWKTQQRIRQIMDEMYSTCPDGLIGNEDCGQMSAWIVMSALGIYSVTPGTDVYVFGTPWFEEATIHMENGKAFTLRAPQVSSERCYIQSVKLNSQSYTRSWLSHFSIESGGELEFTMGPEPNPLWGQNENDRPISKIHEFIIEPVPFVAAGEHTFKDSVRISLADLNTKGRIYYTIDGSTPTATSSLYNSPFVINHSATVKAVSINENGTISMPMEAAFFLIPHDHTLTILSKYEPQYTAGGDNALADGLRGGDNFRTGRWQGFQGTDVEAIMDIGSIKPVKRIGVGFIQDQGAWVFMPSKVAFYISNDKSNWKQAGEVLNDVNIKLEGAVTKDFSLDLKSVQTRYIKFKAFNPGPCPAWHLGAGGKSWLFADEFIVE
ncbi:MAG TPA: glycosyl hydrolase family 92 [Bacteroidales bacterium]|nr:MAG: hypothetical protein A2X11_08455 [Bacteroidetes bacterium GWE2_42_24]OFY30953.1 MAG: hypothetical protein A2X09_17230 [Bacteroidetes bacterium GWF2_43_11]HBZ66453.1 glycosyl hydrolase family 92 [Bacteroidales bacterium]